LQRVYFLSLNIFVYFVFKRSKDLKKSKIRAHVEHVFATQKERMGLFIRTIGLERAKIKMALANLSYNMQRLIFWEKRARLTG
jgi:hypothetical protein